MGRQRPASQTACTARCALSPKPAAYCVMPAPARRHDLLGACRTEEVHLELDHEGQQRRRCTTENARVPRAESRTVVTNPACTKPGCWVSPSLLLNAGSTHRAQADRRMTMRLTGCRLKLDPPEMHRDRLPRRSPLRSLAVPKATPRSHTITTAHHPSTTLATT